MSERDVEQGIKKEKAKESCGIFMTLGLVGLCIILAIDGYWVMTLVLLFAGLGGILKFYFS